MIFDPFGDYETRGYLRNVFAEKDPEVVKRQEHHVFRLHVGEALDALQQRPALTYRDVLATHARLFADYYPWAGQDRLEAVPTLAVGKADRFDLFAHPRDIRRAVEYGLDLGNDPKIMQKRPDEVMGLLAYAHPWLDGNGRTLMVVHADLSRRAGIHIGWEHIHKLPYLSALTRELEQPGKVLDQFLAPFVRASARPLTETARRLQQHPGLGPPAEGPAAGASSAAAPDSSAAEPDTPRPRSGPNP